MAKATHSKRTPPTADARGAIEGNELARVIGPPSPDQAITGVEGESAGFGTYGISGLTRYGTVSRVYEEFLRELQGPQGMKNYREMYDNDPIVGAIMYAAQHLSRKVSFKFKPANDSNKAKEIANFIGSCIFDDMESTWPDTLSEILTMLPFGWALMEFRLKRRLGMGTLSLAPVPLAENRDRDGVGTIVPDQAPSRFDDGLIGFRSWSLRSQETLFMWEFDTDSNAVVMQQMAPPDYRIRRIPLTKSLLFRTQVSKNNPEGRSVLRNAWVSYYMKKNLQVFEGIGVERDLAGYPMIQIEKPDAQKGLFVPDVWNTRDPVMVALLASMQKIVRSVRRDEQEGIVMPWWAKFSLVSTGSRRSFDTNSIIGRYDQRVAMSMMADFIMLGHEAVGSKALAATKISLFTSSLSSFLDVAAAVVDRRAVPVLMQMNGWPMELSPTLEHGDVESVNLQDLGTFIAKIAGTGFNPLATPAAQRAVMNSAKLPSDGISEAQGGPADNNPKNPANVVAAAAATAAARMGDAATGEGDSIGGGGPVDAPRTSTGSPDSLTIS